MTGDEVDRLDGARQAAVAEAFGGYASVFDQVEHVSAGMPAPRSVDMLLDVAGAAGLVAGMLVVDAGCRDGRWAAKLRDRFGCEVAGVDLAFAHLPTARGSGTAAAQADVRRLPIQSGVADVVWCREVLECVGDPVATLREFARVLRPGGALVIWDAFPTDQLEVNERAWLFEALRSPGWWGEGRAGFEGAFAAAGLRVDSADPVAPESTEWLLLHDPAGFAAGLVTISRMRRGPDGFRAALGDAWYRQVLAWELWPLYLLLGKLQTVAWVLRPKSSLD